MNNRELAVLVAIAIAAVGFAFEFVRARMRLKGFSEVGKDLRTLALDLNGEIDRDGDDLLLRGNYGHWPVMIRFSRSEYEAGVSIQMPVPAHVTLYCYPVGHQGEEGQTPLAISDERFMAHFRLSTNNTPLDVSMILSSPAVLSELSKITDSQTYLTLENRTLELSEAVIVPEHLGSRLMGRVRGMTRIASEAAEVHGSGHIPATHKKPRNYFRFGYMGTAALILIVLAISVFLGRRPAKAEAEVLPKPSAMSIPAALSSQIPQLQGWHVASANEFDVDATAWLQQQGQRPNGHIAANLDSDQSPDEAYVFKREPGPPGTNGSRFVLFIDNKERYDAEMPQIDAVARISKDALGSVEWRGKRVSTPAAGGVIVIQRYRDPSSAIVFFVSGSKLVSAVPKDFRNMNLE